jgi:hypothetical protein
MGPETTTTLEVKCTNNSQCARPIPFLPYCEGKFVKTPDVKYTCIHPGAPDSYCQTMAATPRLVKACEQDQYCWGGECWPSHCGNRLRDWPQGEERIDCGGDCRPCNQTDVQCAKNSECGQDTCTDAYCNAAKNPTANCTINICDNAGQPSARCTQQSIVRVLEICTQGMTCYESQAHCLEAHGKASCHDCTINQGEQDVDCGGPCEACASRPPVYDTLNLTATETVEYQQYTIKLGRLTREITCSTGAEVTATDPYGFSKSLKISMHEPAEFYDIKFGMISADTNSIKIWITKKIPI